MMKTRSLNDELLKETETSLRKAFLAQDGRVRGARSHVLNVTVSPAQIPRAIAIMKLVLREAEKRDYAVRVKVSVL